jgi:hypothetical protein
MRQANGLSSAAGSRGLSSSAYLKKLRELQKKSENCSIVFSENITMDTDTPRTDEALNLHYSEGDYFGEETTKEAYEFARELERELNEMTAKQNAKADS